MRCWPGGERPDGIKKRLSAFLRAGMFDGWDGWGRRQTGVRASVVHRGRESVPTGCVAYSASAECQVKIATGVSSHVRGW